MWVKIGRNFSMNQRDGFCQHQNALFGQRGKIITIRLRAAPEHIKGMSNLTTSLKYLIIQHGLVQIHCPLVSTDGQRRAFRHSVALQSAGPAPLRRTADSVQFQYHGRAGNSYRRRRQGSRADMNTAVIARNVGSSDPFAADFELERISFYGR